MGRGLKWRLSGCALLATLVLAATLARQAAAGERVPSRPVLIVADEQKNMQVLAEFLVEQGFEARIVNEKEMPADLAPFYAVFQYIHGPMQDATGKAHLEYARGGGRLILLHHAIASARRNNPGFLPAIGVDIPARDDPKRPWLVMSPVTYTLVNLQPQHYITSHNVTYDRTIDYQSANTPAGKFPALDLPKSEAFGNIEFTDGQEKTVLFGMCVTDPKTGKTIMQDRAGWLKPAGKGWIFHLQPGHAESDWMNRNYCQIVCNCLTWKPQ